MTKKDYSVVLEGVEALSLPVSVLRDLCDLITEGTQRCTRLLGEGRSVARGIAPTWVVTAAEVRVSKFASGSLDLGISADRLTDMAPDIFAQQNLFPGQDPDATAFDLFLDAAADAVAGTRDSERLDAGVLEILAKGNALFPKATRLTMTRHDKSAVVLEPEGMQVIKMLAEETPEARVSRVGGVLDTLTVSSHTLALRLMDGRVLRGFASNAAFELLKGRLGKKVVLEGTVTFRPSGDALRIEVESVLDMTDGDAIWAMLPRVEPTSSKPRLPLISFGLDESFGKWPGDESDAELATALKDLS